jgi:protein-disulfide isomerase
MSLAVATSLIKAEAFDVENFVKSKLIRNKSVKVDKVRVLSKENLKGREDWQVYMILIDAKIGKRTQTFPEILLVNEKDKLVTMSLLDMDSGDDIAKNLKPKLSESYYDKKHLILGNPDAPNKVVVFSDPQCPFCKEYMPKIIKDVKANPDKLALYYYHMPLLRIHPASGTITKVMEHLQSQGKTEEALSMYKLKVSPRERNEKKILAQIKKQFNIELTPKDINTKEIKEALKFDEQKATEMMVRGTPTVYFNGEYDKSRMKYKEVIKKDKKPQAKAKAKETNSTKETNATKEQNKK